MTKTLHVTGTGDSLFVAPFPAEYDQQIGKIADFIRACDIRMTNLETNLSDFNSFASAYSGGTWINVRRHHFEHLLRYGFNYFGTANNHVMDYSYAGLLSTLDTLDQYGLAHSGTGRSLEDAARPAVLEAKGQKVAIFAVDTSFEDASRAGRATHTIMARPGVNFLRHETLYKITPEQEQQLRAIADQTHINFTRQLSISTGFLPLDPPGIFVLGKTKFTTNPEGPVTRCHAGDKKRLLDAIRTAKQQYDLVFILVHCHDDDSINHSNPPEYLQEFVHDAVDAGVSAVFGGGCHSLRGIEIYNNVPIFYSLGDFVYQGLKVEMLPADFMEKFNADIYLSAYEALMVRARGGKVGLQCHKENYQTFLPKIEFSDGKMTRLSLLPVYLNFDRKDDLNGLPMVAEGREKEEILEQLKNLCKPFGTTLQISGDDVTVPLQ